MQRQTKALLALVGLMTLAGCSASGEQEAAQRVATEFAAASSATACDLLAPDTRDEVERQAKVGCEQALPTLGLPTQTQVHSVSVAGHSAQVQLEGQTVFLARFDAGWRVTAAGCSRDSDDQQRPYQCTAKGS